MKVAVVVFPGSSCAPDAVYAYRDVLGLDVKTIWHQEDSAPSVDLMIIPGGAAYGDYLRPGALTKASPVVGVIRKHAQEGRPLIGIGNGFQILCELDILPGVLLPNTVSRFLNTQTYVCVDNTKSVFTKHLDPEHVMQLPICCYNGRYFADKRTLKDLEEEGHIAFRFCDVEGDVDLANPYNGSANSIAAILSRHENVLGMIHHPERAIDPERGSVDGRAILESVMK